eukprot:jgi/Botrbrau1/19421/Bobra.0338s0048.2
MGQAALKAWEAAHGPLPGLLRELLSGTLAAADARWDQRLVAWLLWLRRHKSDTFWQDFWDLFPAEEECSLLLNYSRGERTQLQSPSLVQEAKRQRRNADYVHFFMSKFGFVARDQPQLTFRAMAAVRSRAFSVKVKDESITFLVPFADLANHSLNPTARFDFNQAESAFELHSITHIKAGSEVLISYGLGKDNDELMRDYGFSIAGNIFDRVAFSPPGAASSLPVGVPRGPKLHPGVLIKSLGLAAEYQCGELLVKEKPADVAAVRRYNAALSLPLVGAVPQFFGFWPPSAFTQSGEPPPKSELTAEEVAAEKDAIRELREVVERQLAEAPTTAEQDEVLLEEVLAGRADLAYAIPDDADDGEEEIVYSTESSGEIPAARFEAAIRARLEWKKLLLAASALLQEYESAL